MPTAPFWRTPLCLAPRPLRPWLRDTGSLTARLQAHFAGFKVRVVGQGWQRAHRDECAALNLRDSQTRVATREVLLCAGDTPLVFAHSITLRASLRGGFHLFDRIGTKPLGALLFADPTIARAPLSWCRIDRRHRLWRKACAELGTLPASLWARRSVFQAGRDLLLVTEVFLPALDMATCAPAPRPQ